jgi:hypothetical protein
MLVSVASFLPIIIVGPVADLVGNVNVLFIVAVAVFISGILSIYRRGRLRPEERHEKSTGPARPAGLDPVAVSVARELEETGRRHDRSSARHATGDHGASAASAPVAAPADVPEAGPSDAAGAAEPDDAAQPDDTADTADWPTGLS